jgi:hypothetical protein
MVVETRVRVQVVPFEQIIEFAAIAFGQSRRQCDIAFGQIEQANQIIMFKLVAGIIHIQQFLRFEAQCPFHQLPRNQALRAQHHALFNHIE